MMQDIFDLKKQVIKIDGKIYFCKHIQKVNTSSSEQIKLYLYDYEEKKFVYKNYNPSISVNKILTDTENVIFEGYTFSQAIFTFNDTKYLLDDNLLSGEKVYLKVGERYTGVFYNDKLMDIILPDTIALKVIKVERKSQKFDIFQSKNVLLETDEWFNVPLDVQKDDIIIIDTQKNLYIKKLDK